MVPAASAPARQTPRAPAGQDDPQHRLAALRSYGVLDTPREAAFDDIASLVARLCDAPQDEHRRRTRGAGFDRHLVKPAEVDVLMELLAALSPG